MRWPTAMAYFSVMTRPRYTSLGSISQIPAMSAPNSSALSFRCCEASAGEANARRSAAISPSKRGYWWLKISCSRSVTSGIRIERPPTAAYQSSQANGGGEFNARLPIPNSQRRTLSRPQLGQDGGVAVFGDIARALAIPSRVGGRQRAETVHVPVEHAEGGGDQHGIVNLDVGRTLGTGAGDVRVAHLASAALYARSDREQCLHLGRHRRAFGVGDHSAHHSAVITEVTRRDGGVAVVTEGAVVEGRDVRGNELALAAGE